MNIVVIGGGAAGLMAAGTAAEAGAHVTLLEKNEKVGRKLFITGKGRCNVCNNCDTQQVLENVPVNPRFLYSALGGFGPADVMAFFEAHGVPLKTERGGRVFPASDRVLKSYTRPPRRSSWRTAGWPACARAGGCCLRTA